MLLLRHVICIFVQQKSAEQRETMQSLRFCISSLGLPKPGLRCLFALLRNSRFASPRTIMCYFSKFQIKCWESEIKFWQNFIWNRPSPPTFGERGSKNDCWPTRMGHIISSKKKKKKALTCVPPLTLPWCSGPLTLGAKALGPAPPPPPSSSPAPCPASAIPTYRSLRRSAAGTAQKRRLRQRPTESSHLKCLKLSNRGFLRDPAPKTWLSTFWLLVQISESTTSVKHVVLNNQTSINTRKTKGSCLNQRETKRVAKGTSNLSSLRARHIRHLLAEFPGRCQNQRVRCLAPRGFWAHAFGNRPDRAILLLVR